MVTKECEEFSRNTSFPHVVDAERYTGLVLGTMFTAYFMSFTVMYLIRRRHSEYLQDRMLGFVLMTVGYMQWEQFYTFREYTGFENFPCLINGAGVIFVYVFLMTPLMIRTLITYRRFEFAKLAAKDQFLNELKTGYSGIYDLMTEKELISVAPNKNHGKVKASENLRKDDSIEFINAEFVAAVQTKPFQSAGKRDTSTTRNEITNERYLKAMKFLASEAFAWLIFLLVCILFISPLMNVTRGLSSCNGCEIIQQSDADTIIAFMMILLFFIVTGLAYTRIRNEPDQFGKIDELRHVIPPIVTAVIVYLVLDATDPGGLEANGQIYWGYILSVGYSISFYFLVPKQIVNSYIYEKRFSSDQFIAETDITFEETMESEIVRNEFKRYLVSEQCLENFLFWLEVRQWKKDYEEMSEKAKIQRFRFMCDVFISENSILQINIDSFMRKALLKMHDDLRHKMATPLPAAVFDDTLNEVNRMVIFGPYLRFKNSEFFPKDLHKRVDAPEI